MSIMAAMLAVKLLRECTLLYAPVREDRLLNGQTVYLVVVYVSFLHSFFTLSSTLLYRLDKYYISHTLYIISNSTIF
jgi:hypothetical protein